MSESKIFGLPTRFDYSFHKLFNDKCSELIEDSSVKEIILDFGLVEYIDSSALGMLVILQKKSSTAGKKLKISRARGTAEEVLRMANIQKMIEFIN